jgi:hypothetical protein
MLSQLISKSFLAKTALLTLPMILTTSQKSLADDIRDFIVYNQNELTISRLYIASPNSNSWGQNILKPYLASGESATVKFSDNSDRCVYAMKAVYSNGTYDIGRHNLCGTYFVYFYGYGGDYSPRR